MLIHHIWIFLSILQISTLDFFVLSNISEYTNSQLRLIGGRSSITSTVKCPQLTFCFQLVFFTVVFHQREAWQSSYTSVWLFWGSFSRYIPAISICFKKIKFREKITSICLESFCRLLGLDDRLEGENRIRL